MMANRKIFNANTQQVEDAELAVDNNNEIVATFEDGSIVKFPAGLTKDKFEELIAVHEEVNSGKVVITPEVEAEQQALRENSLALIGEAADKVSTSKVTGDTTPEGEQSNADRPSTEDKPA